MIWPPCSEYALFYVILDRSIAKRQTTQNGRGHDIQHTDINTFCVHTDTHSPGQQCTHECGEPYLLLPRTSLSNHRFEGTLAMAQTAGCGLTSPLVTTHHKPEVEPPTPNPHRSAGSAFPRNPIRLRTNPFRPSSNANGGRLAVLAPGRVCRKEECQLSDSARPGWSLGPPIFMFYFILFYFLISLGSFFLVDPPSNPRHRR